MKNLSIQGLLASTMMLCLAFSSNAQEQYKTQVTLDWHQTEYNNIHSGKQVTYWTFDRAASTPGMPELARYLHHVPVSGNGTIEVSVTPIRTSSISIEDQAAEAAVSSQYRITSSIAKSRTLHQGNVSIDVIRAGKNGMEKLEEFELTVTYTPSENSGNATTRDGDHVSTSVLSSGTIYKIAIPQDGVYKIDGKFISDQLGMSLGDLNTANFQLFGNKGGRLPTLGSADQPDDLQEIPILMVDGGDDNFESADYFAFYADGPDNINTDNEASEYIYDKNVYSQNNYVFLKVDGIAGARVPTRQSSTNVAYKSEDFDYVERYELDRTNLLGAFVSTEGTGKEWFGDYYGLETSQNYGDKFDFSDVEDLGAGIVKMRFAARGDNQTTIKLQVNNSQYSDTASGTDLSDIEVDYAKEVLIIEPTNFSNGQNQINIEYVKSTPQDEGWLDYIQVEYSKKITDRYNQIKVRDRNSMTVEEAGLAVPSTQLTVWDITDINNTAIVSPAQGYITYDVGPQLSTFMYVKNEAYLTPESGEIVTNQNLHSIDQADLVIAYHPTFEDAARRLAEHRTTHNGYDVVLVNILEIYNEFGSGRLDPTALRDFSRMLIARDSDYRYLLLLGDGSYDYRGITPNLLDHNFIPVYETDESFNSIKGFPSDDYYALLDDDENGNLRGGLDLSIGRLPVTNAEMANDIVSKIISYDVNPKSLGDWRLRAAFAADDEDTNTHLNQIESIAKNVSEQWSSYNQTKIYWDSYLQESTPGGDRYPDATAAINNAVQKGTLLLNYMGHGGPKGWSQERVLKISDIETWNNADQLPILITATCSFTGYDDPSIVSAGEVAIQKKNGGVLALLTTVRAVFASDNKRLVEAVFDVIFERENGKAQTLGDIITRAKNGSADSGGVVNDRKFSLIGDPSQLIALPTYQVNTTSVNGVNASVIDTISALEQVTISGNITDESGQILSDFNGRVFPTVFDKASTLETIMNDPRSRKKEFSVFRNILFKGSATVTNGEFEFTFVMPQDINYDFGKGRISYYAHDEVRDAGGNFSEIIVGGTDPNAVADDEGPEMLLYMNDEKFVFGGTTDDSPTLLAVLSDDLGINVSGTSIGHDITAIIDEDSQNSIVLNEFYEANTDDYTSGKVRFPLKDLAPGKHTITVKAWDVSNNSTEQVIEFVVVEQEGNELRNVFNYPNPFSTKTTFMFEHDLVGSDLEVYVDIYTVSGRLVKTIEKTVFSSGYRVDDIEWNAKDDFQSDLAKGLYLYKIRVFARALDQQRESDFEKLVKI